MIMFPRWIVFLVIALLTAGGAWSTAVVAQESASVGEIRLTRLVTTTNPDSQLLAAGPSGLHRLDGDTWVRVGDTAPAGMIVSDGQDGGTMLVGEATSCMVEGPLVELQRSTNGGATWGIVDGATGIHPLAIWKSTGLALGSSCAGIHLSTDSGLTWAVVPGIDPGWSLTAFADVSTDPNNQVVLVGLTGEGGTTFVRRIDFSDPDAPIVSESLREYFAIGGLAGNGDTWLQAAMDGAWITTDGGASWIRSSDGLEGIVLERDPLEFGLPQDLDTQRIGLYAAASIPNTADGFVAGSADGVYIKPAGAMTWSKIDGTTGKVTQLTVSSSGDIAFIVDDTVRVTQLPQA